MDETIKAKAKNIKLLLLDVDGVLTDGTVWYGPEGELVKPFNVKDGSSLVWLKRAGVEVGILTGRTSPQVQIRAKELGIELVIQGAIIKLPIFEEYLQNSGTDPKTIAYMGDDLHDITILKRVGLSMAPGDAVGAVKEVTDWVSQYPGGRGAVREAAELILNATGKWDEVTARYQE